MPFGLYNATATFQRLMAQALTRVTKKYGNLVMCYVDDVVIATPVVEVEADQGGVWETPCIKIRYRFPVYHAMY